MEEVVVGVAEDIGNPCINMDAKHALDDMGLSASMVIDGHVAEVVAHAQGGREALAEVVVALVEESQVLLGSGESAEDGLVDIHADVAPSTRLDVGNRLSVGLCESFFARHALFHQFHHASARHGVEHAIIGIVLDGLGEMVVHGRTEDDRSIDAMPEGREESTGRPLPFSFLAALQGNLLRHRLLPLVLLHPHEVCLGVVDVHVHVVAQVLKAGS